MEGEAKGTVRMLGSKSGWSSYPCALGQGDKAELDELGAERWTRKSSIPNTEGGRYGELGDKATVLGAPAVAGRGKAFMGTFPTVGEVMPSWAMAAMAAAVRQSPHRRR